MISINMTLGTANMCRSMADGEGLTPTPTSGLKYDGVLQDADFMGKGIAGHIFGATPRFADGEFIETSEIVAVGNRLCSGWFVETVNGSRYLVSSINYNPTLPDSTVSVEAAMMHIKKYLSINHDHFRPLQWSKPEQWIKPAN